MMEKRKYRLWVNEEKSPYWIIFLIIGVVALSHFHVFFGFVGLIWFIIQIINITEVIEQKS